MSARSLAIKGALKAPRDINSRPAPKTATVAPRITGGTSCLRQFRIRVQILPLKHVASRQLLDGMSESLGSTASGSIFLASPRSTKRSAGLKKRRRRGCQRTMKRLSLVLRSRDRIEPVIRTQITPRATAAMAPSLGSIVQHDDVAGGSPSKQRPDQLHGHRLVALRTLIPLQAIGERMCVGGREVARRGGRFTQGRSPPGQRRLTSGTALQSLNCYGDRPLSPSPARGWPRRNRHYVGCASFFSARNC